MTVRIINADVMDGLALTEHPQVIIRSVGDPANASRFNDIEDAKAVARVLEMRGYGGEIVPVSKGWHRLRIVTTGTDGLRLVSYVVIDNPNRVEVTEQPNGGAQCPDDQESPGQKDVTGAS